MNMRWNVYLIGVLAFLAGTAAAMDDCPDRAIQHGTLYDARPFLTNTQKNTFKTLYPDFDQQPVQKDWKWADVDPLGLFTPTENRARRRENFLFEYSSDAISPGANRANVGQLEFKGLIGTQIKGAKLHVDRRTAKISAPYTEDYESSFPACNLLEKLAELGLQWAQVGGQNLYVYNGTIFLGSYKSGWVSVANHEIDDPPLKLRSMPTKPGTKSSEKNRGANGPI